MKGYLLNLLGNIEVVDLIAPHVTQLSPLLSEPACRLIKPLKVDFSFIEVEEQYLFNIAVKPCLKESESLEKSLHLFVINTLNLKNQILHHL